MTATDLDHNANPIDLSEGRDELNLAEFPLFFLGQRVPAGVKTLNYEHQIYDSAKNRHFTRRLEIAASDKYGLPTVRDADVLLALVMIAKQTTDFTSATVSFNRYELTKILGWDQSGTSYRRIENALRTWKSTTLFFDNGWWDKEGKDWTTGGFSLIDEFTITHQRRGRNQAELRLCTCQFSPRFFGSLKSGNIKKLDLAEWFSLRIPAAKQMYRFLDKRFYFRKKQDFDLREFAHDHIGLSRNYSPSKLKDKLQPAIDELVSIGFLDEMPICDRYVKVRHGEWRVIFTRSDRKLLGDKPLEGSKGQRLVARQLIKQLTDSGMTAATARGLVEDPDIGESRIKQKLEILQWYQERDAEEAPKNPGGWLAMAIRDDYQPPAGFETHAEREARKRRSEELRASRDREFAEKRVAEERRLEADRQRAKQQKQMVEEYLEGLTPQRREELIDEAIHTSGSLIQPRATAYRRNPSSDDGQLFYDMAIQNFVLPLIESEQVAADSAPAQSDA